MVELCYEFSKSNIAKPSYFWPQPRGYGDTMFAIEPLGVVAATFSSCTGAWAAATLSSTYKEDKGASNGHHGARR